MTSDSGIKIVQPTVYVVGRQTVDDAELSRFLTDHGISWESDSEIAAEVLTETAGRTCYMSFAKPRPGGNAAYLEHIKEVGHGSVLEHAVWNLLITGVSRSLTHELVRHRAGFGFSQLSQRYVDESVAEYVEPDIVANDPELHRIWVETVRRTHDAYIALSERLSGKLTERYLPRNPDGSFDPVALSALNPDERTNIRKGARQAARSVLPNATETKIFITGNARALRHFIEQRGSRHAEPEIRKLAGMILKVLESEAPHLFDDYHLQRLPDGTDELTTEYRKV